MTLKDKQTIKGIIYGYFNGSNDYNDKECNRLTKIIESLPVSQPASRLASSDSDDIIMLASRELYTTADLQ